MNPLTLWPFIVLREASALDTGVVFGCIKYKGQLRRAGIAHADLTSYYSVP